MALVVDRTLLGEAAAEDAQADPSSLLMSGGSSSGAPGARPATNSTARKGGDASSAAAVSNLLNQMAERNRRQLEQTPDAFQPGSAWSAPDMTQPGLPTADVRVETFAKRKLASIVAGGRGKAGAMVDGRMIQIGQSLDGFTLVSVDGQSALFEGRAVQVRLSLAGEARVTAVRATGAAGDARGTTTAPTGAGLSGR